MRNHIQEIKSLLFKEKEIQLFIQREDLNHPLIQGNKYYKLKYNIQAAQEQGKDTLLTFGGAFSNHIYATAAAGKPFELKTIGMIRGERIEPLNPTLEFAEKCGMQLHFISRENYERKKEKDFIDELKNKFGDFYLIPEGGTNELALKGAREIIKNNYDFNPTHFCVPVGTGGTIAGMIQSKNEQINVIGFSSLKGNFLEKEVQELLGKKYNNWGIINEYHFGGYAKWKPELIDFINQFKGKHSIPLEPIYTGKMMYGIMDLIQKNHFPKGSKIVAIHTGGLQGIQGFNQRFGEKLL